MTTSTIDELGCKNAIDLTSVWSHWFLYGPSGAGKTEAASTFPRPVFIVPQNEQSIATLRGKDVPYFEVVDIDKTPLRNGTGGMTKIIDRLEHVYSRDPNNFPFDTIVVDALSHYQDLAITQISAAAKHGTMGQPQWGELATHLRNVQTRLRRMQVHVVFIALDKVEENEEGTVVIGGPLLSGATAQKLPSSCDVSAYCEVITSGKDSSIFRMHTRRYRHFMARSRFKRMPPMIENFHFDKIAGFLEVDPE